MQMLPLGKRVLVKPFREKERDETEGGIIIPETAKQKCQQGEVVAVGSEPMDVKVGDKIYYGKFTGTEVKVDYKDYIVMNPDEILGIIEE